jgi:hypothetical protein
VPNNVTNVTEGGKRMDRTDDSFVALVLILGKLLRAEDRASRSVKSEDEVDRAIKLISEKRDHILEKLSKPAH